MAGFPSMIDPQSRNLIYAMDDLLAFGTSRQDHLLTRFGFQQEHKAYLEQLGFEFQTNTDPIVTPSINGHQGFQCISESLANVNRPLNALPIIPYSVTQGIVALNDHLPSYEVAARVNSKAYSTAVSQQLCPGYQGTVIRSSQALNSEGITMLKHYSKIVLKESFGVAGNGNLIINSEKTLGQIVRQFSKQEAKDRSVELVIEPFLEKALDFSSHWEIDQDGSLTFLGFQQMHNEGFAFSQIAPLPPQWEDTIRQTNYFDLINITLNGLYDEGYFGPVCIDSMILKDHSIIPIVEINARMSMGLLNYRLNEKFKSPDNNGTLLYLGLLIPIEQQDPYGKISELLKTLQLNYVQDNRGFMVLSANTVRANSKLSSEKPYRARLYLWHSNPKKNTLKSDISRLCTAMKAEEIDVQ